MTTTLSAPEQRGIDELIRFDILHTLHTLGEVNEVDATNIDVRVAYGIVTLRGSVPSWSARQLVERAVCSTPDVDGVYDELLVACLPG